MAYNSLTPKRHWLLRIMRDRRTGRYYIDDAWTRSRVTAGIPTLDAAQDELRRLKHEAQYRQVATIERPSIPWAGSERRGAWTRQ